MIGIKRDRQQKASRRRKTGGRRFVTAAAVSVGLIIAASSTAPPASATTEQPSGGTAGSYCNHITDNGKAVNWEQYYKPVNHSFPYDVNKEIGTIYCLNPKWDDYSCIGAIDGLAFTLIGAGIEARAALALGGGIAIGIPGIWSSC